MEENQNFTPMNGNQSFTSSSEPVPQADTASAAEPFMAADSNAEAKPYTAAEPYTATEQFTSAPNYNSTVADGPTGGLVQKPVNYLTGIIGALVGVVIGIVLWVIIFKLGYIAGIAGAVMMICSIKGFEILGGRINAQGIIICIVIDLIAVYFAHNIAYALEIMQEMKEFDISFTQAYKTISVLMKSVDEFKRAYYHDLIMGYALTVLAVIPSFIKRK